MYYVRVRIPKDVKNYFPKHEIKRSLHTSSYTLAKSFVKLAVANMEKVFSMIRSKALTAPIMYEVVERFLDTNLLNLDTEFRSELLAKHEHEKLVKYTIENADEKIRKNKEYLAKNTYVEAKQKVACEILEKSEISIDKESPEFNMLCRELAFASIKLAEVLKARGTGERHPYEDELKNRHKSDTLQTAINDYLEKYETTLSQRSLAKIKESFSKIIECFKYETGKIDIRLNTIDSKLTQKVAKLLTKYPCYRNTRYNGKTLDEIYSMDDVQFPSEATIKGELYLLSTLFNEASENNIGLARNYASKMSKFVIKKSKKKKSEYRDAFNAEDINKILAQLLKFKLTWLHSNPHLYLIPLISLYSGMRVNEICQLYVDDIIEVDGIWCFNNKEDRDEKSLKNENSIRINPIHPDLIEIGLLNFREYQIKKGFKHLWEGGKKISCKYYKVHGNHSHYFDKWFNGTFKKHLQLANPQKKTFHSFRHTFLNWYKQNVKLSDYWQAITALTGHLDDDDKRLLGVNVDSIAYQHYTDSIYVKTQLNVLKMFNVSIDISTLKIDCKKLN
jgi:integrase